MRRDQAWNILKVELTGSADGLHGGEIKREGGRRGGRGRVESESQETVAAERRERRGSSPQGRLHVGVGNWKGGAATY